MQPGGYMDDSVVMNERRDLADRVCWEPKSLFERLRSIDPGKLSMGSTAHASIYCVSQVWSMYIHTRRRATLVSQIFSVEASCSRSTEMESWGASASFFGPFF